MIKKDSYELAQLTEIAYIAGCLPIDLKAEDIEEARDIYIGILNEWSTGVDNGIFKNIEEEGYIGAYAERVLLERYGK